MTLGTGIFASTVLVLLAIAIWQITARHKWKLAGKIAAGFVAVCAVIGGGLYAWSYVSDLPPAPTVVTELAGVKLGMSPTDVTLALGKPDTASDPSVVKGKTRIEYAYSSPDVKIIFYGQDKYTTKAAIVCSAEPFTELLGFGNSSAEASILQQLGKPSSISVARDALTKAISFSQWNAAFVISKGLVSEKCLTQSGRLTFADELISPEAQKAVDQKAAAEAKLAAEARLAALEKAIAEARRAAEAQRISGQRAAEAQRVTEQRAAEAQRVTEQRAAEAQRVTEQRAAEAKKTAEAQKQKAAEQEARLARFSLGQAFMYGKGVPEDIKRAYMWTILAGEEYAGFLQTVAVLGKMTPAQIAEAQAMARKCQASNFKQCD